MPLILAIEPDRRQSTQLTAVVRSRLHADLVLAESAERALAALGDRVPDLILTSALLSPKDEGALAERLRSLNGDAARVQTLTIPVLAPPKPRSTVARGLLSALRRARPESPAPDGCDPAVFADQCAAYLDRAAAERAQLAAHEAEDLAAMEEPPVSVDEPVVPEAVAETSAAEASTPDVTQPFAAMELAEWDVPLPGFEVVASSESERWEDEPFTIEHDLSQLLDAITCQDAEAPPHVDDDSRTPAAFVMSLLWPPMEGVDAETSSPRGEFVASEPPPPMAARSRRPSRSRPVQDEWGFFDPDQCGFAALIAKLEEMTKTA